MTSVTSETGGFLPGRVDIRIALENDIRPGNETRPDERASAVAIIMNHPIGQESKE